MEQEIALKVEQISKTFRIPHENRDTIRERLLNFRKKMSYETFKAIDDVSFEIHKGEFFSIIGRNGSGKSTLLKILAGIYTPDNGSVNVNGEISPFLELGVGFNPELSGKDNIYLNGTILGLTKKEIDKKYQQIVEFSELERFIDVKLKNYSSGMQVRLAFSVSVHANKDILLLDEVLAVGDASFQIKCFDVLDKIIKSGRTIVFVSHDHTSIQKFSSRVLYLDAGRISFLGSPNDALAKYTYTDVIKESQSPSPHIPELSSLDDNNVNNETAVLTVEKQDADTGISPRLQKIVEIEEVIFFDTGNKETNILYHGQKFRIEVVYQITEPLNDLIFGIIIRNHLHHDLFVTNTYTEKIQTGSFIPGKVTVVYEIMNYFASGKYSVSPAVCDHMQRIFYDWKDDLAFFQVYNPNRLMSYTGMELPHAITIKTN